MATFPEDQDLTDVLTNPLSFVLRMSVQFGDDENPQALNALRVELAQSLGWTATFVDKVFWVTSPKFEDTPDSAVWHQRIQSAIDLLESYGIQQRDDPNAGGVDVYVGVLSSTFNLNQLKCISGLFLACQSMSLVLTCQFVDSYLHHLQAYLIRIP